MSNAETHSFVLPNTYKQEQNENDQMHKNDNISYLDLSTLGPIAIDCDYNIYNNWRLECDKPNQLKALPSGTPSEAVSKSDNTNGYVILAGYDYESEGGCDTYGYSKTLEEAKQIVTESVTTGKTTTPPHFRDENDWEPIPESEIDRLQQTLYPHVNKMKISLLKPQRIQFVKDLLQNQNNTCAFGKNVGGKYCWNEPKDSEKKYLKLQWGHIKPRCRKDETHTIKDLCLLCARCNNQIQTSRYLCQLKAELQSKLDNIDNLIKSSK